MTHPTPRIRAILGNTIPNLEEMKWVKQCCVCKRIEGAGGRYYLVREESLKYLFPPEKVAITHGYCPDCYQEERKKIMGEVGK